MKIILTVPNDLPEWKLKRLMTAVVSEIGLVEIEVQHET